MRHACCFKVLLQLLHLFKMDRNDFNIPLLSQHSTVKIQKHLRQHGFTQGRVEYYITILDWNCSFQSVEGTLVFIVIEVRKASMFERKIYSLTPRGRLASCKKRSFNLAWAACSCDPRRVTHGLEIGHWPLGFFVNSTSTLALPPLILSIGLRQHTLPWATSSGPNVSVLLVLLHTGSVLKIGIWVRIHCLCKI